MNMMTNHVIYGDLGYQSDRWHEMALFCELHLRGLIPGVRSMGNVFHMNGPKSPKSPQHKVR